MSRPKKLRTSNEDRISQIYGYLKQRKVIEQYSYDALAKDLNLLGAKCTGSQIRTWVSRGDAPTIDVDRAFGILIGENVSGATTAEQAKDTWSCQCPKCHTDIIVFFNSDNLKGLLYQKDQQLKSLQDEIENLKAGTKKGFFSYLVELLS